VAVLAVVVAAVSWGQDVKVSTSTFAQYYKADIPGLDNSVFAPLTQFLSIDATGLGYKDISLHLFGWGNFDLADQTRMDGKSTGSISNAYVLYRSERANGELRAGRFSINHGLGYEQVDGASGSVDLKGGFSVSAFGGRPVHNRIEGSKHHFEVESQRDSIFGARVGYHLSKIGQAGVFFVQDITSSTLLYPVGSGTTDAPKVQGFGRGLAGGDF
jgi:hypothetical protein